MGAIRIPKFLWDLNLIPKPDGNVYKALCWNPNGSVEWRSQNTQTGIWYGTKLEYDALDEAVKVPFENWNGTGYFEFHVFGSDSTLYLTASGYISANEVALSDLLGVIEETNSVSVMIVDQGDLADLLAIIANNISLPLTVDNGSFIGTIEQIGSISEMQFTKAELVEQFDILGSSISFISIVNASELIGVLISDGASSTSTVEYGVLAGFGSVIGYDATSNSTMAIGALIGNIAIGTATFSPSIGLGQVACVLLADSFGFNATLAPGALLDYNVMGENLVSSTQVQDGAIIEFASGTLYEQGVSGWSPNNMPWTATTQYAYDDDLAENVFTPETITWSKLFNVTPGTVSINLSNDEYAGLELALDGVTQQVDGTGTARYATITNNGLTYVTITLSSALDLESSTAISSIYIEKAIIDSVSPPSDLVIGAVTDNVKTTIPLSWVNNTHGNTEFNIEWCKDGVSWDHTIVAGNVTSFNVDATTVCAPLGIGETLSFRVKAVIDGVESATSNITSHHIETIDKLIISNGNLTQDNVQDFVVPAGASQALIECIGEGGGRSTYPGGCGGGAYASVSSFTVVPSNQYRVIHYRTQASLSGDVGFFYDEGSTPTTARCLAKGGKKPINTTIGGVAGLASECIGELRYSGGAGGDYGGAGTYGGGGAGACSGGNGGNGTTGTGPSIAGLAKASLPSYIQGGSGGYSASQNWIGKDYGGGNCASAGSNSIGGKGVCRIKFT